MALKKREILHRVLDGLDPGKWTVAKPQGSEDPDPECILQNEADNTEVRFVIDNFRFRHNHIDDIRNLVESAINSPYLLRTHAAISGKGVSPVSRPSSSDRMTIH